MKTWIIAAVLFLCPAIVRADIAFMPSWRDKICPEDAPLLDDSGKCQACDADQALEPFRSGDCSVCPDRYDIVFHHTGIMSYKTSHFCLPTAWKLPDAGTCPEDRPLRGEDDYCYPCSLIYFYQIPLHNSADRSICPEKPLRELIRTTPLP